MGGAESLARGALFFPIPSSETFQTWSCPGGGIDTTGIGRRCTSGLVVPAVGRSPQAARGKARTRAHSGNRCVKQGLAHLG